MDLRPRRSDEPLRREVESPQRQPSGLGVMLLASAAMFFAVAGSAFILRSQMAATSCPYRNAAPPVEVEDRIGPAPIEIDAPSSSCQVRSPVAADGSQLIEFRVCAE